MANERIVSINDLFVPSTITVNNTVAMTIDTDPTSDTYERFKPSSSYVHLGKTVRGSSIRINPNAEYEDVEENMVDSVQVLLKGAKPTVEWVAAYNDRLAIQAYSAMPGDSGANGKLLCLSRTATIFEPTFPLLSVEYHRGTTNTPAARLRIARLRLFFRGHFISTYPEISWDFQGLPFRYRVLVGLDASLCPRTDFAAGNFWQLSLDAPSTILPWTD